MNHVKARKPHDKNDRPPHTSKQRQREEAIDILISGLDALAVQAEEANLGTAARIFFTAKEELVHWAVNMNFHESAQDRFINQRLYGDRLFKIETFINRVRAIKDSGTRAEVLGLLGMPMPKTPSPQDRK